MSFTYDSPYSKGNRKGLVAATIKEGCTEAGNINNMLDGSQKSDFYFANTSDVWITFEFSNPVRIEEIKWIQSKNTSHGQWKLQGSNDNIQFIDLGSHFVLDNKNILIENKRQYKYYKLQQIEGSVSRSPWLYEIEFGINPVTNKFLLKQNNDFYTIKSEFYKNGEFQPIEELKEKKILTQDDFKIYGFDDLNLLIEVVNETYKGSLSSKELFEDESFKPIDKLKKNSNICEIFFKEV